MADVIVDARGLKCPMPIIKLSQALGQAAVGQTVELISTDRGSCTDVPAWTADMGHVLKEQTEQNGEFRFLIQKV
jgi:TusA-related sulfurtransferase